jgi:hypothetical protein
VFGQVCNFFEGAAVQHDESHLGHQLGVYPSLKGGLPQELVHFHQRRLDKGHPAIFSGQIVEDVGVKDKDTLHFLAVFEGVKQGGVVVNA